MFVCARACTNNATDGMVFLPRRRRRRRLRVKYDRIRPRPREEMCDTREGGRAGARRAAHPPSLPPSLPDCPMSRSHSELSSSGEWRLWRRSGGERDRLCLSKTTRSQSHGSGTPHSSSDTAAPPLHIALHAKRGQSPLRAREAQLNHL